MTIPESIARPGIERKIEFSVYAKCPTHGELIGHDSVILRHEQSKRLQHLLNNFKLRGATQRAWQKLRAAHRHVCGEKIQYIRTEN